MIGRAPRPTRTALYSAAGDPVAGINGFVLEWLSGTRSVREHNPAAAFDGLRAAYAQGRDALIATGVTRRDAHMTMLSTLTDLMLGSDLRGDLAARLDATTLNPRGFRTALSQGMAKNSGENFTNVIVFALADLLADQDEVVIDKGLPPPFREALTLRRTFAPPGRAPVDITMVIEVDAAIWRRADPMDAIVISAKTRLKEVFHIGTMWKILFDMIGDAHSLTKWGLRSGPALPNMRYVFATADMIAPGGATTQGPDIGDEVRNLIRADASFFDYVFVSKTGLRSVGAVLDYVTGREDLFHELGLLVPLVEQKFGIDLGR